MDKVSVIAHASRSSLTPVYSTNRAVFLYEHDTRHAHVHYPLSFLEQLAALEQPRKFERGKNENAVLGAAALGFEADDQALLDARMILH